MNNVSISNTKGTFWGLGYCLTTDECEATHGISGSVWSQSTRNIWKYLARNNE